MIQDGKRQGTDLFIVDNDDKDWKVRRYLHDWADLARAFDVATGYFEIGALLALEGQWQKLDKLRILMGDEVSKRTRDALLEGVESVLDKSIEERKKRDDFLSGVPAIVDALRNKQIECRVYAKRKFHAKAYITHARQEIVGPTALVGSSNFTLPGLTDNVELNVQVRHEVNVLQDWYERHWDEGEDVTPEVLRVIERHTREYSPFEIYAKALQEYFRSYEITAGDWENRHSRLYPELDQYQKEGYQALVKIARKYGGAFLCDGVGLGKTFIGMMVIERLVEYERKRVALIVPKAARKSVWEDHLSDYLPQLGGEFSDLVVFNHTDLLRKGEYQERLERVKERADAFVIDEAHHFRNPGIKGEGVRGPSRYWKMFDLAGDKELYLLTATPVNNRLIDLQHMMELFSRRQPNYFGAAPLGIHSLPGYFRRMEKELQELSAHRDGSDLPEGAAETDQVEAEQVLSGDRLFRSLVVQRSRAYVKQSQIQHAEGQAIFPEREDPKLAQYSVKKTYGGLLQMMEKAFSKQKPLFSLAMYYPLAYSKGPDNSYDPLSEGRQRQVVGLIRTLFLKRFESSARAFEMSCQALLWKLMTFVKKHSQTNAEKRRFERWQAQHADLVGYVQQRTLDLFGAEDEEPDEDVISDEMLDEIEELSREEYDVGEILAETFLDLEQVTEFLEELKKFEPSQDDKLHALIHLLKTDPVLKKHKVLIFTEFMATARYLEKELKAAGITGVAEVDSAVKRDRREIIQQFAPYYNRSSTEDLRLTGKDETRVLISTDVLSEGLNLQDATRLINYDLHWNPVRLMQRIGRVDRRMNPRVEKRILTYHPEQKAIRGTVAYWNFLPPDELDRLLSLYQKVSHKVLQISSVFGIEGKKLLTPQDDFEALRDFNHSYEGTTTSSEEMHLEYQKLLQDEPSLKGRLDNLPGRVFGGREHPSEGARAIFFCYALPAPANVSDADKSVETNGEVDNIWTEEAGYTRWYLYDLAEGRISEEASDILPLIRSTPETPRHRELPEETLTEIRKKVEKHMKNTYLKSVQAPQGVKATLKAWMELS